MDEIPGHVLLEAGAQGVARQMDGHHMQAMVGVAHKVDLDLKDLDMVPEEVQAHQGVGMQVIPMGGKNLMIQFRNLAVKRVDDDTLAVYMGIRVNGPGEKSKQEVLDLYRKMGTGSVVDMSKILGDVMERNGDAGEGPEHVMVLGMNKEGDTVAVSLKKGEMKTRSLGEAEMEHGALKAMRYVLDIP